jgi:heme oxygenase
MMTLRDKLREATGARHTALERTALMITFTGPSLTRAVYADYLGRQWQLHAAMEAELGRWAPPGWAQTRLIKVGWLAQDLAVLGLDPPPQRALAWPAPTQATAALGAMYVLEGATLGVQIVARRAPQVTAAARRFLDGYGGCTGARWREFLGALEGVPGSDWDEVCRGALDTFDAFLALFSEPAHEPIPV